jgi:hypothetical protein
MAGYQDGKSERERRRASKIDRSEKNIEKSLKWLNICKQKAHLTN